MIELNKIVEGNCLTGLKELPDECVDCCPTSPPYFGLRDYGVEKTRWDAVTYSILGFEVIVPEMECCLGLEETPKQFIGHLVAIFREVKRVLKKEGTTWINIGDSYNGSGKGGNPEGSEWSGFVGNKDREKSAQPKASKTDIRGLKAKDLIGIPWMLAYALRDDGWFLRQDIIWNKPNPMPESVTDRCTKAHEYIFLMSKSGKYYYDAEAIKTRSEWDIAKSKMPDGWDTGEGGHGSFHRQGREKGRKSFNKTQGGGGTSFNGHSGYLKADGTLIGDGSANKRSVWTVITQPYADAHFATFPEDLIVDMIKAGCPEGGTVLDPFMGAGTTAVVAKKLNRNYLGFELNPEYIKIANKRLYKEIGMFL